MFRVLNAKAQAESNRKCKNKSIFSCSDIFYDDRNISIMKLSNRNAPTVRLAVYETRIQPPM